VVIEQAVVNQESEKKLCDCGRSSSGYCVGLHNLSQDEWIATKTLKDSKSSSSHAPAKKKTSNRKPKAKNNSESHLKAWPFVSDDVPAAKITGTKRKSKPKNV